MSAPEPLDEDAIWDAFAEEAERQEEEEAAHAAASDGTGPPSGGACQFCGSLSQLVPDLAAASHFVCFACMKARRVSHGYGMLAQSTVQSEFHLSKDDLLNFTKSTGKTLATRETKNPKGFGNNMILYYRFQILEVLSEKHGSLETAVQNLEELRETQFARSLGVVKGSGPQRSRKRGAPAEKSDPSNSSSQALFERYRQSRLRDSTVEAVDNADFAALCGAASEGGTPS